MLYIGIDEAGYGPLLGPLVIGLSALRVEASLERGDAGADLRERLAPWVRRADVAARAATAPLPVPVDDSKRVHARYGISGLARAVGVFAAALDQAPPADLEDLLRRHADVWEPRAAPAPWSRDLHEALVPRYPWTGPLRDAWADEGIEAVDLQVLPLPAAPFNAALASGNKAHVLGQMGGTLLLTVLDRFPGEDARVVFDRHGSRRDYRPLLQTFFGEGAVTEIERRRELSSYEVRLPDRQLHVTFATKADLAHLPVSWASVAAKLTRELFMERLNDWFVAFNPSLRRTAGYVVDGRRFVAEIEDVLRLRGIPRSWLIRER